MNFLKSVFFALALPVVAVGIWWVVAGDGGNFFVPPPGEILERFFATWFGERFFVDVVPSVARLVAGLLLAVIGGVALGVLIGTTPALRDFLEPLLEFFRAIPAAVLLPILMLFLGPTDLLKVVLIFIGCLWPILLNTVEGVRSVDEVMTATARTYRISGWSRMRYLVLPSASPRIIAGVRQSLSVGLILMVISEMFASSSGIGYSIIQFQRMFAIADMWAGILLLGLIGVLLFVVFGFLERRILNWYFGLREVTNGS
ncbi:ABC transporter permease [Microbacterium caowuchunii]|uniref:ABC transporter permease n=1 Tax=Microbacterium caowuchunii TaxID=2614638 RepID=UPI0012452110|nr:ABC transporter permease [Microbacterium caowuchunii]QEV99084.1 ABC transporter permease [Microbacterium caowuchunii]